MRLGRWLVDLGPLRASRDFRLVLAARLVSLLGLGLGAVAVPLQVYGLTGSSVQVGAVAAVTGATALAGTLTGGVLADRLDRRRLILAARATATVTFAVLAGNAALPEPRIAVLYVCAALNGATAVSNAALLAATPALVGRERLVAAGALVTLSTQLGAVAGPGLAGLVLAGPGLVTGYALTAAASLVTTLLIALLRPLPPPPSAGRSPWRDVRDGASFVRRDRAVGGLLLLEVPALLFAVPTVLFPQLADQVLGGGPATVGLLVAAPAAGAVLAAVASGWTGRVRRAGTALVALVIAQCGTVVGVGLCAAAALTGTAGIVAALGLLALGGAARTWADVLRRGLLLLATPEPLQGRVSAVWLAQVMAAPSLGGLVAGSAAHLLGPGAGLVVSGGVALAATLAVALALPAVRQLAGR